MISRRQLPELRVYAEIESELPLFTAPELGDLVVPNGNASRPVHRWFKYKEAFSADLLGVIADRLSLPRAQEHTLLDPFCGVGTTLLSAQLLSARGYRFRSFGIECNPLAALVARAKTNWGEIDVNRLQRWGTELLEQPPSTQVASLPTLSSIITGRCISRTVSQHVIKSRDHIQSLPESPERDALMIALAAVIEPLSRVRRDGRALRIVDKPRGQFRPEFRSRLAAIVEDTGLLQRTHPRSNKTTVHLGDGRTPQSASITPSSVDLILTSPPYPNNIDYNEVYKLELWLLGLTTTATDFLGLRRQTFRSHPTCSPVDPTDPKQRDFETIMGTPRVSAVLDLITARVRHLEERRRRGRLKVLLGYAFDTWRTLVAHHQILRPQAHAVYVVGNSLHGSADRPYLIATDLLFARFAEAVGFTVESILVARPLQRRVVGNHFLRDSVVVLRKQ